MTNRVAEFLLAHYPDIAKIAKGKIKELALAISNIIIDNNYDKLFLNIKHDLISINKNIDNINKNDIKLYLSNLDFYSTSTKGNQIPKDIIESHTNDIGFILKESSRLGNLLLDCYSL